jgi:6-phosphogluconolactonase (cycloisomerase 2 family)
MGARSGGRLGRVAFLLAAAALVAAAATGLARSSAHGGLAQLDGRAGCVGLGGGGCSRARALLLANDSAVSPDGRHVYVAAAEDNAVLVFARSQSDGRLKQLAGAAGCVSEDGSDGLCADGRALVRASTVAVSRDGDNVYVSAPLSNAVAVFARDSGTGELTQLPGTAGCVSNGGGGDCADGRALRRANSVTVSPDGDNVYVAAALSDAIAVFARDRGTGELTQLPDADGCVSETGDPNCADGKALVVPAAIAITADGRSAYVASRGSGAIAVFARDAGTGALTQLPGLDGCVSDDGTGGECQDGRALLGAISVVAGTTPTPFVTPQSVYAAASSADALAAFSRDPVSGALTQLPGTAGCVSEDGTGGECQDGKALRTPLSVTLSPDGRSLYGSAFDSDAVSIFSRDPGTGALTQLAGLEGCVSEDGTSGACADGKALESATSTAISDDGDNVYVTSWYRDGAVAVFTRH